MATTTHMVETPLSTELVPGKGRDLMLIWLGMG